MKVGDYVRTKSNGIQKIDEEGRINLGLIRPPFHIIKKEKLFAITQPTATTFDKERVAGGNPSNRFDDYLILKEKKQVDQRLNEIKSILADRERLLKLKENELRNSTNIQDKIYRYRYLDKMKVEKIMRLVSYSRPQVYRILRTIRNNIK